MNSDFGETDNRKINSKYVRWNDHAFRNNTFLTRTVFILCLLYVVCHSLVVGFIIVGEAYALASKEISSGSVEDGPHIMSGIIKRWFFLSLKTDGLEADVKLRVWISEKKDSYDIYLRKRTGVWTLRRWTTAD